MTFRREWSAYLSSTVRKVSQCWFAFSTDDTGRFSIKRWTQKRKKRLSPKGMMIYDSIKKFMAWVQLAVFSSYNFHTIAHLKTVSKLMRASLIFMLNYFSFKHLHIFCDILDFFLLVNAYFCVYVILRFLISK